MWREKEDTLVIIREMDSLPSTAFLYCDDFTLLQLQAVCKALCSSLNERVFVSLFLASLAPRIHTEALDHAKFQTTVASLPTRQFPLSALIKAQAKRHFSPTLSSKLLSPGVYLMRCCEYGVVPDAKSIGKMENVDHGICLLKASTYGHLHVLDALDRVRYTDWDYWRVVNNVFAGACRRDRVEVYKWLTERRYPLPQGKQDLELPVIHGAVEIFKLAFARYGGICYVFFYDIMRLAIQHEREGIIETMLAAGGHYSVFLMAAQEGKLKLVKKYESNDIEDRCEAMEAAIYDNHYNVVQYLHDTTTFTKDMQDKFLVEAACASRETLRTVQRLYPEATLNVEQALVECVERDRKNMTRFWVTKVTEEEKCRVIVNILNENDYPEGWSCLKIIASTLTRDVTERCIEFAFNPRMQDLLRYSIPSKGRKRLGRRGREKQKRKNREVNEKKEWERIMKRDLEKMMEEGRR